MELVKPPPPPPAPRPSDIRKALIARRRADVAEGLLKGKTHTALVKELGVSFGRVKSDIRWLTKTWREAALGKREHQIGLMLQKNLAIQREAWEAWERSKAERKTIEQRSARTTGKDPTPLSVIVRKEERDGGYQWLALLQILHKQEMELRGLLVPAVVTNVLVDNRKVIVVGDSGLPSEMPWMNSLRQGLAEQGKPFQLFEPKGLLDEITEPIDATEETDAL